MALARRLPNLLRKRVRIINGMQIGNSRLQLAYYLFQVIKFGLLLAFAVMTIGTCVGASTLEWGENYRMLCYAMLC